MCVTLILACIGVDSYVLLGALENSQYRTDLHSNKFVSMKRSV